MQKHVNRPRNVKENYIKLNIAFRCYSASAILGVLGFLELFLCVDS